MTSRFEPILAAGIAQLSYLVGDDATGVAAVVDPRPDVDVYLEIAPAIRSRAGAEPPRREPHAIIGRESWSTASGSTTG